MSSEASTELQRLLRMLTETATKAESEAYAAGWRDCRAALMKALSGVGEEPQAESPVYTPVSELNGANGMLRTTNHARTSPSVSIGAQRQCCQLRIRRPVTRP